MDKFVKSVGEVDQTYDAAGLKIGIVYARWNFKVIDALRKGAVDQLLKMGVKHENIIEMSVPGSYELPMGVKILNEQKQVDSVIAIGTLIKGSTMHFEYISDAVSHQLMKLQFEINKPIIFGLLTCLTEEQAEQRAGLVPGKMHNHGTDWGAAAVEMSSKKAKI